MTENKMTFMIRNSTNSHTGRPLVGFRVNPKTGFPIPVFRYPSELNHEYDGSMIFHINTMSDNDMSLINDLMDYIGQTHPNAYIDEII